MNIVDLEIDDIGAHLKRLDRGKSRTNSTPKKGSKSDQFKNNVSITKNSSQSNSASAIHGGRGDHTGPKAIYLLKKEDGSASFHKANLDKVNKTTGLPDYIHNLKRENPGLEIEKVFESDNISNRDIINLRNKLAEKQQKK